MMIEGECDFCGKYGDWEGGIFNDPESPKGRPKIMAAFFPTKVIPEKWRTLGWASSKFCEEHNIETKLACPKCYRK